MRVLKLVGYGAWFGAAFLIGIVVTFPIDGLKGIVIAVAEEKLGKGSQGRHGTDPSVQIGSLTLSLASFGVKAKDVRVQLASDNPDPGPTIELDAVTVGVRPWTLLSNAKTISVDASGYGGNVDGTIEYDLKKNELKSADVEVDEIDLGRLTVLMEKIGVPLAGKLSMSADLDLGENAEKEAKGKIKVSGDKLAIGPGTMKLGAMKIEVKLEQGPVDLGKLTGEIDIDQGKGLLNDVKLSSPDVSAELFGEVFVKSRVQNSRLDLDGFFLLAPALLVREKSLQSAIELGEKLGGMGGLSLSKAKDDEGRYYFSVKGTVQSPFANLANDNGRRAKARAAKSASGSEKAEKSERFERPERSKRERPPPPPRPPAVLPPPAPVSSAAPEKMEPKAGEKPDVKVDEKPAESVDTSEKKVEEASEG